jgi:glucose dehydrogenase
MNYYILAAIAVLIVVAIGALTYYVSPIAGGVVFVILIGLFIWAVWDINDDEEWPMDQ